MNERKYAHVIRAILAKPWAIDPDSLAWAAIVDVLTMRAAGKRLKESEIEARIGAARNGPRGGGGVTSNVMVIPLYGVIANHVDNMKSSGGTSIDGLRASFREALGDSSIDAIVFDVDSPGGSVDGIEEFAREVRSARSTKPIVAVANTVAFSAAYWIASQAQELYVTLSGAVGSIGVFAAHQDLSKAEEMMGIKTTLISSSPFKVEGNQFEPLGEDARAAIQEQVDAYDALFTSSVARGRGVPIDTVRSDFGQGRTVLAAGDGIDPVKAGMVDGIGTLDDAIKRAAQLASGAEPISRKAAVAVVTTAIDAGPGPGLPFPQRLAWIRAEVADFAEHAKARADMRSKDGRDLSDADRDGLNALAGSLRAIAEPEEPPAAIDPEAAAIDPARPGLTAAQVLEAVSPAYLAGYPIQHEIKEFLNG